MENFEAFAEDIVEDGQVALPFAEGVALQIITNDDLGHAVAVALANPDDFPGDAIALAGGERTLGETATNLTEIMGQEVDAVRVPIEDAYETFGEEFIGMY